jgi:hypothetical protein
MIMTKNGVTQRTCCSWRTVWLPRMGIFVSLDGVVDRATQSSFGLLGLLRCRGSMSDPFLSTSLLSTFDKYPEAIKIALRFG